MSKRESEDKTIHDRAVQAVSRARFVFPNKKHPSWQTHINEPFPVVGIHLEDKLPTPDIVVLDARIYEPNEEEDDDVAPKEAVVMIGEVETSASITPEEVDQWTTYARIAGDFYLYVPKGFCAEAKSLAVGLKISGFREYQLRVDSSVDIVNC